MAHRQPGSSQPRTRQEFQHDGNRDIEDQREDEIALVAVEQCRSRHLDEGGLAGKGHGRQDDVEGGGEGQSDDGKVDAAQAQRRQADGDAQRHGGKPAEQDPCRQSARRFGEVEITHRPCADTGEGHLAQRDHAGATGDETEALQRDAGDQHRCRQEHPIGRQKPDDDTAQHDGGGKNDERGPDTSALHPSGPPSATTEARPR